MDIIVRIEFQPSIFDHIISADAYVLNLLRARDDKFISIAARQGDCALLRIKHFIREMKLERIRQPCRKRSVVESKQISRFVVILLEEGEAFA